MGVHGSCRGRRSRQEFTENECEQEAIEHQDQGVQQYSRVQQHQEVQQYKEVPQDGEVQEVREERVQGVHHEFVPEQKIHQEDVEDKRGVHQEVQEKGHQDYPQHSVTFCVPSYSNKSFTKL